MKSLEKLVSKTVKNVTAVKGGNSGKDLNVKGFEASADLSGSNGQELG